jgi:hypothetical protein
MELQSHFIDVSIMKNIQEKLQNALNYAEDIIYIAHEPLLVLDQVLIIVSANKSFYGTFKLKKINYRRGELIRNR